MFPFTSTQFTLLSFHILHTIYQLNVQLPYPITQNGWKTRRQERHCHWRSWVCSTILALAESSKLTRTYSGIGLETTILMLREGASVLMTDISEAGLAQALNKANEIVPPASRSGKAETRVVDVASESQVEAAVAHLDSWGGLDVMFNNAGIMHPRDGDSEECPEDIWDRTMNINVKGVWFGSKHAVRSFRKHGKKRGSVINTASMVALVGAATPQLAYTASKGAVLAMTRELAIVHAREGNVVNCLTFPSRKSY